MHYNDTPRFGIPRRVVSALSMTAVFAAGWAVGTYEGRLRFGGEPLAGAPAPVLVPPLSVAPAPGDASPVWDLPNLDHDRVDYWVERFSTSKRREFARYLSRMGRYQ